MSNDDNLTLEIFDEDDVLENTTILDISKNNRFLGSPQDDNIVGGNEDDTIRGGKGNDIINGMGGNNRLVGDEGNDTLSGAGIDLTDDLDITLDQQGIDTLTGGVGKDRFMLGENPESILGNDASPVVFYDRAGNQDYALITDFNPSQDKIVLGGSKNDYSLAASPNDLPEGTGIFREDELIAIVAGNTQLNLGKSYFQAE